MLVRQHMAASQPLRALSRLPTLEQLRLSSAADVDAVGLADALKGNAVTTSLHLKQCRVSDAGAAALADVLRVNATR